MSINGRVWFSSVGLSALALAACTASQDGREGVAHTSAALTTAPLVSAFVVLARQSASFDDRSVVSGGDVGVGASTSGAPDSITAGFDSHTSVGHDLIAQSITLRDRAVAGNIDTSALIRGASVVVGTRSPFLAPPVPPSPTAAIAGTTTVTVNSGTTTALAAGSFGTVTVNGTLNLSGGLYQVRSLVVNSGARVVAQASSVLRIATGLIASDRAVLLPAAGLHAGALTIEAGGTADGTGSGVSIGNDVQMTALVIASRGITAADRLIASGALAGQAVTLGHDTKLTFDTGFGCGTNADCSGGGGSCAATCVDAQCVRPLACTAVQIAAGTDHACAAMADTTAQCWGDNSAGEVGTGKPSATNPNPPSKPAPTTVVDEAGAPLTGVTAVATEGSTSCAVLSGGTVDCWGILFDGEVNFFATPMAGVSGAVALSGHDGQMCALLAGGDVNCLNPNEVPASQTGLGATAIAVGGNFACAIVSGGNVVCWGGDGNGQLGDGSSGMAQTSPIPVKLASAAVAIAASDNNACAILTDSTIECWGRDDAGQIGDGLALTNPPAIDLPTHVVNATTKMNLSGAVGIAIGSIQHACAVLSDGTVECWGANEQGELGDNSMTPLLSPSPGTAVLGLMNATQVAAGENFSCALVRGGSAFCWGMNADATLGNAPGQQDPSLVPLAVVF